MRRDRTGAARALLAAGLLAAGAAGCSSGPPTVGARLGEPPALVPFVGITSKYAGLHDYVAVASRRNDDLAFIDPIDDQPVLGPGVVFPLSIPTAPRPMLIAAASLGDRDGGGADLLVAVSSGDLDLQVVETWTATNRLSTAAAVALGAATSAGGAPVLPAGSEITAIVAMTAPGASVGAPRARLLVGAALPAGGSPGRLVVVDFTRDSRTGGVTPQPPVFQDLDFVPGAMAVEPGGTRIFIATSDPIPSGGVDIDGVAMVDAADPAALPWAVSALDARAPAIAVTAARVRERLVDPSNPSAQDQFDPVERLRVYAVLDPSGCGTDKPIDCGVVTLDPDVVRQQDGRLGLVPDPAAALGEALPYRAPMQVPGVAAAVAVSLPPASGSARLAGDAVNGPDIPLMRLEPGTGTRDTTAAGAVTSSDGNTYELDIGRYAVMNATSIITGTTRVGVTNAQLVQPVVPGARTFALGLWNDFPLSSQSPVVESRTAVLPSLVQVTPGYTPTDEFRITWQGALPGLANRRGVVGRLPSGDVYVAVQARPSDGSAGWVVGAQLTSPGVGVHVGDVVVVSADDPTVCPSGTAASYPEPAVGALLDAQPDYPGGALQLAPGSCFAASLASGQVVTATVTVRAGQLVATSDRLGYLGRPAFDQAFAVQYDSREATGDPSLSPEAQVIARKVRRRYYPSDPPCATAGCYTGLPWLVDPLAFGPAFAVKVGLFDPVQGGSPSSADPAVLQAIPRGAQIAIATQSGVSPAYRKPVLGGALPSSVIPYDKTGLPGHQNDPIKFYAAYLDNQLLSFTPSTTDGSIVDIQ